MVFTIMKRIKNITFICILAGMIAGCTGNFDSMNKNPLAATEVTPSLLLTKMEEYGFNCRSWEYQLGNKYRIQRLILPPQITNGKITGRTTASGNRIIRIWLNL